MEWPATGSQGQRECDLVVLVLLSWMVRQDRVWFYLDVQGWFNQCMVLMDDGGGKVGHVCCSQGVAVFVVYVLLIDG